MAQDSGYDWRAEARRLWLAEAKRAEDAGDRKQAAYARRVASETLTETITGITSRTGAGYWRYY